MSFFSLSICKNELKSASNITFLPNPLPSESKKLLDTLNPSNPKFIPLNIPSEYYINYYINFYDNNKTSKNELIKICQVGSRPGILYGNLKGHKPVV